jgi:predicted CoA-binding protein
MNIRDFFNYKNWAVVGTVSDPSKFACKILKSLKAGNFKTEGVNPKDSTGEIYKSLSEVPYEINVIDLCINPTIGIEIVKEAKKLNIDKILIQPGAESEEIIDYCKANGILAIEGCALVQLLTHFNVDINQF